MAATARIDELRARFDENPRRYFAPLANEYRKAGDPETAIAICRTQLARYPAHMSGHVVLGQALHDTGQLAPARQAFSDALTLDPENLIALHALGDLARAAGDDAEARRWYARILDADPHNEEVAAELARLRRPAPVEPGTPLADWTATASVARDEVDTAEFVTGWGVDEGASAALVPGKPDALPLELAPPAAPPPHAAHPSGAPLAATPDENPEPLALEPLDWGALDLVVPEPAELHGSPPDRLPDLPRQEGPLASVERPDEEPESPAVGLDLAPPDSMLPPVLEDALEAPLLGETFVTETMAGLLLQQGHREQALAVYARLVAQRPDDAALRARVAQLREGAPAPDATVGEATGQSVGSPGEPSPGDAESNASPFTLADVAAAAGAPGAADALAAHRLAAVLGAWYETSPDAPVPSILAALAAAPVLPDARAPEPAAPESGEPPEALAVEDFTFDRFFAGRVEEAHEASAPRSDVGVAVGPSGVAAPSDEDGAGRAARAAIVGDPTDPAARPAAAAASASDAPGEDPDDDLAQFNAWLKGLLDS